MKVFKTAQKTQDHLTAVHGGMFEIAPVDVVGDAWDQDFLVRQVEVQGERERIAFPHFAQARRGRAVYVATPRRQGNRGGCILM